MTTGALRSESRASVARQAADRQRREHDEIEQLVGAGAHVGVNDHEQQQRVNQRDMEYRQAAPTVRQQRSEQRQRQQHDGAPGVAEEVEENLVGPAQERAPPWTPASENVKQVLRQAAGGERSARPQIAPPQLHHGRRDERSRRAATARSNASQVAIARNAHSAGELAGDRQPRQDPGDHHRRAAAGDVAASCERARLQHHGEEVSANGGARLQSRVGRNDDAASAIAIGHGQEQRRNTKTTSASRPGHENRRQQLAADQRITAMADARAFSRIGSGMYRVPA